MLRMAMHCVCSGSSVHPADAASVVQAVPSRYSMLLEDTILLEDEDTASLTDKDGTEECTAAGRIAADVRWQAWLTTCRRRCSHLHLCVWQSACISQRPVCVLGRISQTMSWGWCSSQACTCHASAGFKAMEGIGRQLCRLRQCWLDRRRVFGLAGGVRPRFSRPGLRKGKLLQTVLRAVSGFASTIALLCCMHNKFYVLPGICWPCITCQICCTCLSAACRKAFPAAVVTLAPRFFSKSTLKLLETSTGELVVLCAGGN